MLEISHVSKLFGAFRAVTDMSLVIERGDIHALIGPNGAGKSTLINLVAGALSPNDGDIRYEGRSIAGLPPHRIVHAGIARSFQITSIFPRLTVAENVRVALMARHGQCRRPFVPARTIMNGDVHRLLESVHMSERSDRRAGELAAGDRKRLEFAMALAGEPKLMLLDEPTAGMSPSERALVTDVLRTINEHHGVTVFFTEHDIDMVFSVARKITVMHQGRKLVEGKPTEVRENPRVREIYLGEGHDA